MWYFWNLKNKVFKKTLNLKKNLDLRSLQVINMVLPPITFFFI